MKQRRKNTDKLNDKSVLMEECNVILLEKKMLQVQ